MEHIITFCGVEGSISPPHTQMFVSSVFVHFLAQSLTSSCPYWHQLGNVYSWICRIFNSIDVIHTCPCNNVKVADSLSWIYWRSFWDSVNISQLYDVSVYWLAKETWVDYDWSDIAVQVNFIRWDNNVPRCIFNTISSVLSHQTVKWVWCHSP